MVFFLPYLQKSPKMKKLLPITLLFFLLASCSSRNAFRTTEDRALADAIKKYQKHPGQVEAKNNLVQLFQAAEQVHLNKIDVYKTLTEADRWEKIIGEYDALQKLHTMIVEADKARQALNSKDYSAELDLARRSGAEAYYQKGLDELDQSSRQSAKDAYYSFKKAGNLVPGYKDSRNLSNQAYEKSIIDIVINPVTDNSFYRTSFDNTYHSRFGYGQDNFQRNLVSDLGGNANNRNLPARFYTDYDARRLDISPDWEVNLEWSELDIPQPRIQQYSRNVNRRIQVGSDTSGHPLYNTITATLIISRADFTARGTMDLRINDLKTNRSVAYNRYSDSYNWQEEYATYRGDSRALSSNDWAMIR